MTEYNKLPVIISIVALFLALDRMSYGYYQLIRFLICSVGIYAAYAAYNYNKISWSWTMGIIAFMFNPFIKLYFGRDTWQFIGVVVAVIFFISIFAIKPSKRR